MEHLFRSLMFVPAHNERLMNSAAHCDADILLLDIEDSVQPDFNKQVARENILRYIENGTFHGRILYPRVNDGKAENYYGIYINLLSRELQDSCILKVKKGKTYIFLENYWKP